MKRWLIYIKERFPLATYVLLIGGFVCSALVETQYEVSKVIIGFVGLFLFFAELRLMDEYKDFQKDLVAHPKRPLPRGLLDLQEVKRVIFSLLILMLLFAAAMFRWQSQTTGILYLFVTFYLYCMFKEFFVGEWLNRIQIVYAWTHQIIIVPLVLFCVSLDTPEKVFTMQSFYLSICILGAFFSYEVGRKLNSEAPKILRYYIHDIGAIASVLWIFALSLLGEFASYQLGVSRFTAPVFLILLVSLGYFFLNQKKYKFVELTTTLALLAHLWAVFIARVVG